jgi:hypothetical protein
MKHATQTRFLTQDQKSNRHVSFSPRRASLLPFNEQHHSIKASEVGTVFMNAGRSPHKT